MDDSNKNDLENLEKQQGFFYGLTKDEQEAIFKRIELVNKKDCVRLMDNVSYLEQLQFLTIQMKMDILRAVDHKLLAYALRVSSVDLIASFLKDLTNNLRIELLHHLKEKLPVSQILQAQDQVITRFRQMESNCQIILDHKKYNKVV